MLASVGLYSLFPVFNALSIDSINPALYVFKACIFAAFIQYIIFVLVSKRIFFHESLKNIKFVYLLFAALLAVSAYCLLVYAFSIGSNSAVTILYEMWPVLVFFLMPLFFTEKRINRITLVEIIAASIAVVGVFSIVFSDFDGSEIYDSFPFRSGEFIGLTSGILMAFAVIIKSRAVIGEGLDELPLSDFIAIDLVNRIFAAAIAFVLLIIFFEADFSGLNGIDSSIGFGVIEGLGGLLYWIAISKSRRSSIQLLIYIAPVIAFIWLYILGLAQLSAGIVFGAALIFSANVVAHFRGEQTAAFFLTVLAAIICGTLAYATRPGSDSDGYATVAVLITLYSILIGFLLARLADRNFRQRTECKNLLSQLNKINSKYLKEELIIFMRDSFRMSARNVEIQYNNMIHNKEIDDEVKSIILNITLLRINPISAGEMLATVSTGMLLAVSVFHSRTPDFLGDMTAFILTVVVVYLTCSIIEQKDIRLGEGRIMRTALGIDKDKDDPAFNFVVGGISLMLGILLLVGLALSLKHDLINQ